MKVINEINSSVQKLNIDNNVKISQIKKSSNDQKEDIIDLKYLNYISSDNLIKKFNLLDNQQLHLIYSISNNKISANIVTKDNDILNIKTENLPLEFNDIKSTEIFNKFLENVSVKISILSDNEPKLYIKQKCLGGMYQENTNITNTTINQTTINEITIIQQILPEQLSTIIDPDPRHTAYLINGWTYEPDARILQFSLPEVREQALNLKPGQSFYDPDRNRTFHRSPSRDRFYSFPGYK